MEIDCRRRSEPRPQVRPFCDMSLTTSEQLNEFQDIIHRMDRILNVPAVTTANSYGGYCDTSVYSNAMTRGVNLNYNQQWHSAPAAANSVVELLPLKNTTQVRLDNVDNKVSGTVRVNIGIDEDLKNILDMDPSIIDGGTSDEKRRREEQEEQQMALSPTPPVPPPPDKVLGLPPRAGGYDLVMSCHCFIYICGVGGD